MINIFVSATAARASGALSILNQFIEHIPKKCDISYYIFVDVSFKPTFKDNINYIYIDTTKWCDRLFWDFYGLKRWGTNNQIKADLIISFQNTGVNYNRSVSQIIYFHNLLAISDHKWSLFSKTEYLFYLYKKIYPYFVALYLRNNTHIIVQAPFIKEMFLKCFSVTDDKIYVVTPNVNIVGCEKSAQEIDSDDFIHYIYPATSLKYKNHILLVEALECLKEIHPKLLLTIRIHLTIKENEYPCLLHKIKEYNLMDCFVFEGVLTFEKLIAIYRYSRALLFPSYIETIGLPLLEAANMGLSIIAADLPYAHNAVGRYEGVQFVDHTNAYSWALAIKRKCLNKCFYPPYTPDKKGNWMLFFHIVDRLITK